MNLEGIFRELSRRRVFRVAGAYAVVAWLMIQVAEVSFDAFDVPDWAMRLVILLALLGFPVAIALAWAFDFTASGLERTVPESAASERGSEPVRPARPRALVAGIITVAGIAAAWLTFVRVSGGGAEIRGDPRASVIVFPFENATGSSEWDYLEDASPNLLGLALSHWIDMRVYDDERTASLLRRSEVRGAADLDFDTARELAGEIGFGTFVLGEFGTEGDSLMIEAKVYDTASGDRVATEVARVSREGDPRQPFGTLAAAILQISGAPPGDRPDLLAQTTSSLEAYRAYVEGLQAMQQFDVQTAAAALRRATELDTTFALAYLKRRDVDGWAGVESDPTQRRTWVAKAVAHSAGLPPRYAALVRLHEASSAGRLGRAREIASEMIARDSTDAEAWYQLGEAHFHDFPGRVPRSDSAGDYHAALTAFRKTLELEPGYVLAYQHVVDVLGACANDNPWVCFEDRTEYGPRSELDAEFGAETVAAERARAAEERLEALYAWVSAAPASERAHGELMSWLLDSGRFEDARRHLAVIRAQAGEILAKVWESRIAFVEGDYAGAARTLAAVLADAGAARTFTQAGPENTLKVLLAGGRPRDAAEAFSAILARTPMDTVTGPDNITYSRERFAELWRLNVRSLSGQDIELLPSAALAWLGALDEGYGPGTPEHRLRWLDSGAAVLGAYVATGDTTVLARFTAASDSAPSRTWRVMEALLALERGEREEARTAIRTWFVDRDDIELRGDPGAMRLMGWAHLYERLGEPERAAEAYALFENEASPNLNEVLRVRSWYERGRLLESLGDSVGAAESYERFIAAWAEGDETVQPLVDRARGSLERLRRGP